MVDWYKIVWFRGHILRMTFIVWLAYKGSMLANKRFKQWGCIQDEDCLLCVIANDNVNRLFINYIYSRVI